MVSNKELLFINFVYRLNDANEPYIRSRSLCNIIVLAALRVIEST